MALINHRPDPRIPKDVNPPDDQENGRPGRRRDSKDRRQVEQQHGPNRPENQVLGQVPSPISNSLAP